jgi:glutaminyl-tRNA synthetase
MILWKIHQKKFFRLGPDREVRLKYAYIIKCDEVIKDENGDVTELKCSYDPDTKSGTGTSTKKVKATLHWVSAENAVETEVRLYDRLFSKEDPYDVTEGGTFLDNINPDSLKITKGYIEPFVKEATMQHFQFERIGYFYRDNKSHGSKIVFNRTVTLRDSWAKIARKK